MGSGGGGGLADLDPGPGELFNGEGVGISEGGVEAAPDCAGELFRGAGVDTKGAGEFCAITKRPD